MLRTLLLLFLPALLPAQGIQFEHESWSATLAKAKGAGKIIFVDAYTVWCGPCKAMARDVFTDASVGSFYNANFLNVKMDMEQGDGLEVSTRYKIWVYPSLLFVDGDGNIVHRSTGYQDATQFIALGKTALDPAKNLAALDRRYAAGERGAAFMLDYLETKSAAYDPETGKLAAGYLDTQSELSTPENMAVLMRYIDDPTVPAFAYLLKKRPAFEAEYGVNDVYAKIEAVYANYFEQHPEFTLADIQQVFQRTYPEFAEQLGSAYRLSWYGRTQDVEKYMEAALDHFARFPSDNAALLHEVAWIFCENASSNEALKKALQWAEQSVALDESMYNQFTLARLYAKNDAPDAARKAANRSLELAKDAGEDAEMVTEFLDGLK